MTCSNCGAVTEDGANFCTRCGERLRGGGGVRGWWYAGAVVATSVLLLLLLPRLADRAGPPVMTDPGVGAPFGGPGTLSPDMRTNADRLFNRVMAAAERGDGAEVNQFLPMAVQAYEMVPGLDDDGLYHLAILHLTAGDHTRAIATAQEILNVLPDHILALGVAGAAVREAGDHDAARRFYRRLLDAYPVEAARPRPEYVDHQAMLPEYRREAEEFLVAGGG